MKRQNPSIFNDIVGPLMIGPSSSHTCGPSRIGFLASQLLNDSLKKAVISFAQEGAYTLMYQGQRSDFGYINGLLGRRPENPALRTAFEDAKAQGVEIEFVIEDFAPIVPNISHLTLQDAAGETIVVHADSTGGGTVKLLEIDGFPVEIVGDCHELLLFMSCDKQECIDVQKTIEAMLAPCEDATISSCNGQYLINLKQRTPYSAEFLQKISAMPQIKMIKTMQPVLKVLSNRHCTLPFQSASEMLQYAQETGKNLWQVAIDYEMQRSGWTYEEVWDYMGQVVEIMENSSTDALRGKIDMAGIISPTAGKIENFLKTNPKALDMGILNTAVPWAMATMEYSSAMGVVLCAPTGGSAGIFPGAILGVANHLGLSETEKIQAMFITAIIGIVMSKDCNYSAELYGCQVEPGAASGMAAAALVYFMDGSAEQSCQAASCAVQNILGTICDPVAGLVQIPCINRNAMSVGNAVISANIVMGGFNPLIPLDQTAETLFRVGKQLPSELRCTCKGGLCTTTQGQILAAEQAERDTKRALS